MFQDPPLDQQSELAEYAYRFMVLLLIDASVLLFKIHSGLLVVSSNFNRSKVARYTRFSVVMYWQGLFKLALIDLAMISGTEILISIPIYVLTIIYFMCALFFLPVLITLLRYLDKSYATVIQKEKVDVQRR
jgi:hypothetical protein